MEFAHLLDTCGWLMKTELFHKLRIWRLLVFELLKEILFKTLINIKWIMIKYLFYEHRYLKNYWH